MPGYISEFLHEGGGATDFVEVAVPTGTDTSAYTIVHYNSDGTVNATYSLGSVVSTSLGYDVYLVDSATAGLADIKSNEALALVDDTSTVLQFLTTEGNNVVATEGPANGLTSTNIGGTAGGESHQTNDGGSTYFAQTAPNAGTIPCYAPGTMIETRDGPRAVETLQPGDLVMTLDNGPQEIRWVRSGEVPLEEVEVDGKPVLIAAGSLGKDLPAQDLIVSPQHRILVGGHRQLQALFESEAFAPAKSLTSLDGIRHMKGKTKITWIHFACDRHEVVTANGCLSESLLLGPMVVNGMTAAERQAVIDIFGPAPTPDVALNGPSARECQKVGAVQRLLAKCSDAKKKRAVKEIKKWDLDLAMHRYEVERLREAEERNQAGMKCVA